MSAYRNLLTAVATVVGGNQPDPVNKPYWFSGKDLGDGSGVAGLAGAWWPPVETFSDTPVALIIPGNSKLQLPFPTQGKKEIESIVHVRVMVGHSDLPTMILTVADFHDVVPTAFDTHMQLLGSPNVLAANCDGPDLLEVEWGGSPYAALEFMVRIQRVLPVAYVG